MAVGLPLKTTYANGDVYSASDVNDTNGTVNLVGQTTNFYAGKNKIINGDFNVWQRGTSFTTSVYGADRWVTFLTNTSTLTRQTFTPGTAPASPYEGTYFLQMARSTSTGADYLTQKIEDVRVFAGQSVTLSFWAKADAACTIQTFYDQNFGSGGSTQVSTSAVSTAITTSWARYTVTTTLGAITGKTIGTSSYLSTVFVIPSAAGNRTVGFWGVQLEAGSTATAFQTATGTIQGELAACQRYYFRMNGNGNYQPVGFGYSDSTTVARMYVTTPPMRVLPTSIDYTNLSVVADAVYNSTNTVIGASSPNMVRLDLTGLSGLTAFRSYALLLQNTSNQFLGFSAEL